MWNFLDILSRFINKFLVKNNFSTHRFKDLIIRNKMEGVTFHRLELCKMQQSKTTLYDLKLNLNPHSRNILF